MNCIKCGNEITTEMKFCNKCGAAIEKVDTKLNDVEETIIETSKESKPPKIKTQKQKREWYCVVKDDQLGPLDIDEVKDFFNKNKIDGNTLVWKEGYTDWVKLKETDLKDFMNLKNVPPVLKGEHVNDTWVWTLAFAPLISLVLYYAVAQQYIYAQLRNGNYDILSMQETLQWTSTIIILGLNVFLSYKDEKMLKKAGYKTDALGSYWIIPVYLFKRAKMLEQKNYYAICWIVCFVLSLF